MTEQDAGDGFEDTSIDLDLVEDAAAEPRPVGARFQDAGSQDAGFEDAAIDQDLIEDAGAEADATEGSGWAGSADDVLDDQIDAVDDGGHATDLPDVAHHPEPGSSSGALPFVVDARAQFAALGDPPVTGDARVDAATARLTELVDLPTSEHVTVYDDVHRRLQDALSDADVR